VVEISVIIPTYNRAGRLRACLDALNHQTQPADDYEVIVVVDGSTDETLKMLENLVTNYALRVLYQDNSGQNVARNHGVTHAHGQYCLFLDDDIMASPQLVAEHLRLHRQRENVAGIGQIPMRIGNADWYTKRFADGWHEHYEQLNQASRQPSWPDGYGGNISVLRDVFLEVGGFAPDIRRSHDIEFAYRLEKHGLTFVYLPEAVGRQEEHKRSRELFADAEKSGAAWIILCQRHPEMLPELIGPLGDTSAREGLLREIFWRCGLSPWLLAKLGGGLVKTAWGHKWYRFLFTYGYWRGVRKAIPDHETWQRTVRGVPILMYHAFGKPGEPASQLVLPVRQFARQMAWLKRRNYHVLSLEEYLGYRLRHQLPPPRSVVITIDDGYAEIASHIQPILHRYNFPATVFLVSSKIGRLNNWTNIDALRGRQLLSWEEIKDLACQNIQFGAHSQTHPSLTDIPVEQAQAEITGSKADLEQMLEMPVTTFAYPHGEYDKTIQKFVDQAGFLGAVTVESGVNSWSLPPTALRRIEVEGTWSLLRFTLVLRLGGHF
jgi:glycosyltransferase involved in cell wall biosynthesis/peptidoglycan/xylan/chitin deacetylase (PgdA/CDA1 family)